MSRIKRSERMFQCPECKNTVTAYKSSNRLTPDGHIKTMYCPFCKEQRDFVQYSYKKPFEETEDNKDDL